MKFPAKYPSLIELHILLVLSRGRLHGYEIMKAANQINPSLELGPASLYRGLSDLHQSGLVYDAGRDGRRHLYEITANGRDLLERTISQLNQIVHLYRAL